MMMRKGRGPLTLEKYHRFFVDPWDTPVNINNLNHILNMHGFSKLHRDPKGRILQYMVGQVDLLPPRRSTLHRVALSAAAPLSAAVITTAQAKVDVEAIGWAECPIGCVAAFAAQVAGAPEPVERVPRPADFVVLGRRPRSKRTRSFAYKRKRRDDAASTKMKVCAPQKKVTVTVKEEEKRELSPPPPPRWMRSPTPPPPFSPQDVAPPPPPPCRPQPALAPVVRGSPTVRLPQPPQLYWGPLPLPAPGPGTPLPGLPPGWASPTVPSCYPEPLSGASSCVLPPPLSPRVPWGWPLSLQPHGTSMLSPTARPPMHLQQKPFPAHLPGHQPPPAQLQTPQPPLQLRRPPPHLQRQLALPPPLPHLPGHQPPPAQLHTTLPPLQVRRPPPHLQGQVSLPPHLK